MEWAIIVFILLTSICYIWNIFTNDKDYRFISALLLVISTVILIGLISSYESRNTPTTMDVYRGKTTLEITYKDSIQIDSIVVFKDEFKKAMEE